MDEERSLLQDVVTIAVLVLLAFTAGLSVYGHFAKTIQKLIIFYFCSNQGKEKTFASLLRVIDVKRSWKLNSKLFCSHEGRYPL